MTDLLVVCGERLWPAGGRTSVMVSAMASRFSVRVLAPVDGPPPDGVVVDALPDEEPAARLVSLLSPQPRAGRTHLGPRRSRALLQAVADHRPRALLFAAGPLAAASPTVELPVFVDFSTLSVRGTGLEALKARWWEAVEARRAVAVAAASAGDVALLTSWGARAVLVADGSSPAAWGPFADTVEQVVRAPAGS